MRIPGDLRFLSSVIRSRPGFERLAGSVNSAFHYTLTVECIENRELLLKDSKASLAPDEMSGVLTLARQCGFDTDFTYIVGLDTYASAIQLLDRLIPACSAFPLLQVYQPHTPLMQYYVATDANDVSYFLQIRRHAEKLLSPTGLQPVLWQNYRSLWYYEFCDQPLSGVRK